MGSQGLSVEVLPIVLSHKDLSHGGFLFGNYHEMIKIFIDMTTWGAPSGVNHFKQYEKAITRQLKRRVARISVNMAPMNKSQKTNWHYFSILSKSYFMQFIPRSHIYRDTGAAAVLPGFHGWMFGSLGWSSGPVNLVHWPIHLKSATAADFTWRLCLKNKTQRQSHLTLGYFLVEYHFAPHPPFKDLDAYFIYNSLLV